jgi:hypothetical protein
VIALKERRIEVPFCIDEAHPATGDEEIIEDAHKAQIATRSNG